MAESCFAIFTRNLYLQTVDVSADTGDVMRRDCDTEAAAERQ
jgi:hypothetical protein